jgi:hypothetical protein
MSAVVRDHVNVWLRRSQRAVNIWLPVYVNNEYHNVFITLSHHHIADVNSTDKVPFYPRSPYLISSDQMYNKKLTTDIIHNLLHGDYAITRCHTNVPQSRLIYISVKCTVKYLSLEQLNLPQYTILDALPPIR